MFRITKQRYSQIQRMQKIQQFNYENEEIQYETKGSENLCYLILQEQNEVEYFTMGQLIIILQKIVDQLLQIYQISSISILEKDSIYINLQNYKVTFTNIHISKELVSYEKNLSQIQRIAHEIFYFHQKSLTRLINNENQVDLRKKIEYITEKSNDVLLIMRSSMHHQMLKEFVNNNIKNEKLIHNNFQDVIEIPKVVQANVINHYFYAFIENSLKNVYIGQELYEYMVNYFVKNYKNLQNDYLEQKFQKLYYAYHFPIVTSKNWQEDFNQNWKVIITDYFINKQTLSLEDDDQQYSLTLEKIYSEIYQEQY